MDDALAAPPTPFPGMTVVDLNDVDEIGATQLHTLNVPLIALATASTAAEAWVTRFPWAAILLRPFSLGEVADLIAAKVHSNS